MQIDVIRHHRQSIPYPVYVHGYMAFADASRLIDEWCIKTWWGDGTLRYSPLVNTDPYARIYGERRAYVGPDGGTRWCVPAQYVEELGVNIARPVSLSILGATGDFARANKGMAVWLHGAGNIIGYRGDWDDDPDGSLRPFLRYNLWEDMPDRWSAMVYWSSRRLVRYAGPTSAADCEGTYLPNRVVGDGDGGVMTVQWSHTGPW